MGKNVLILDDDADFNNLLTDIFSQADYNVTSERDPEVAVDLLSETNFDLVVTDQKMPGLSGEEFIREVKASKPDIPIIMVSGYLDNDTIRRLIKDGVGGVFLKPLNVFSLLKRTAALIEERESGLRRRTNSDDNQATEAEPEHFQHSLPFIFNSLPCKSPVSQDFAKKLYSLRNFKTNLIIIAPPGSDLNAYIEDLKSFSQPGEEVFVFVDIRQFEAASLLESIEEGARSGAKRVTLVISHAERLTSAQKKIVFAASSAEPPFDSLQQPLRFIFHVPDDLDELYDQGKIDDDLYMFMGTSEVKAPGLSEIREDIPLLAHQFLKDECVKRGMNSVPTLEPPARVFLRDYDWHSNTAELKRFVEAILDLNKPHLTRPDMQELALEQRSSSGAKPFYLKHELEDFRADLCNATLILCDEDSELASRLLGLPMGQVESMVSRIRA